MIIEQLKELPSKIRTMRIQLVVMASHIENTEKNLKRWEAEKLEVITSETGPDGKPKFSNADKRVVELQRRKEADINYCADYLGFVAEKGEYEDLKIELQYWLDTQENLRAIARLGGSESNG